MYLTQFAAILILRLHSMRENHLSNFYPFTSFILSLECSILDLSSTAPSFVLDDIRYNAKTLGCIFFDILVIAGPGIKHYEVSRFPSIGSDIKHSCGQYYKIYDVVFTLLFRSKEVSVEGIHRDLLSSV